MQRHVFDGVNRVSQKTVESQRVARWLPPTIGKGGKLIHAEPREESQLRQAVAQKHDAPQGNAADVPADGDFAQSYDKGYEEGLLLGRREGLEKGLAEGRAQGQKAGYDEGFAKGQAEGIAAGNTQGLQQADQQVRQQLNVLNSVMTHLTHAINEQDYELEQALLGLVREVSRQVIQRELSVDSSHVMQIIRQALNTLPPTRDNVRILVNNDDKDLVMRAAEEGGENWRVIGTTQIERGGCRVETDHSAVDFTVSARFQQAIEQIANKTFLHEDDPRHKGVPRDEEVQHAPEPVARPLKDTTPAHSLADDANALTGESSS